MNTAEFPYVLFMEIKNEMRRTHKPWYQHGRIRNPRFLIAKQYEYREPFWGAMERMIEKNINQRRVAILDTGQAVETKYLLQLGYQPDRIHVVNRNASHVAWVTMRKLKVRTHCGELVTVAKQICNKFGPLDVVNYDSMGTVGQHEFAATVFQMAGILKPGAILGVTMLASREVSARDFIYRTHGRMLSGWQKHLPEYSHQDLNRFDYLVSISNLAGRCVKMIKVGRYRSRRLDMLWIVMKLGTGAQRVPKFLA